MTFSEWAARNGVHYQTAWTWAEQGRVPVLVDQAVAGTWLVIEPIEKPSVRVKRRAARNHAEQAVAVASGVAAG